MPSCRIAGLLILFATTYAVGQTTTSVPCLSYEPAVVKVAGTSGVRPYRDRPITKAFATATDLKPTGLCNSSPEVLNICGGGRIISVNPEMCGFTSDPWDLRMSATVHNPGELTYNPVQVSLLARRTLRVPTIRHFLMRRTFIAGA